MFAVSDRRETWFDPSSSQTVIVPDALREIFDEAQRNVRSYFTNFVADPATGRIEIGDERYVLVRASALSINFLDTVAQLYDDRERQEALAIGRAFLFDIAHTIGKNDAATFHKKMGLTDPMSKLAAGPVHFAYSGWALVELGEGASPTADDDFCLVYDHPYSFEADSWLRAGRTSDDPVCIMNSGYSSGWCEESFGVGLTAVEITCKARGDKTCTFVMAPPTRIQARLRERVGSADGAINIPSYFSRKREEDALRRSERRLRGVLSAMPLPVLIAGDDATLLYSNSHAQTVFGLEPLSRPPLATVDPFVDPAALGELFTSASRDEQVVGHEHLMRDANGEKFSALVSCHSLVLPDGDSGIVITILDVTDFKQAQASLRVNERMATVGTLAAGVAHEINNPLAYVVANLERVENLLEQSGDSQISAADVAKMRESITSALEGSRRVTDIVRDLRSLTRDVDQDTSGICELEEILESAIGISEVTWRHRARVTRDFAGRTLVRANSGRLGQVFLNIIINAAQEIQPGSVDLNEIRVSTADLGDERVAVEIADSGRGMDADEQARIFDPFFTTKPVGSGIGLGLAISKSIVDKLGGEIEIDSEIGRGTMIRVVLPRAVESDDKRLPDDTTQRDSVDLAGLRVLIVDDEPALTEILSEMLPECVVSIAGSGRAARDALDGSEFDVVLCDLMMPDVTGIELYRGCSEELRERIVFMTGGAFTRAAAAFLREADNPCLDKPIEVDELRRAIGAHAVRIRR